MYAIILAGGSGSRLWPISRELWPKQMLKPDGEYSLLQNTFKRLSAIIPSGKIISVTNIKHADDVKFQLSNIASDAVVLAEPMAKNTAPAVACGLEYIRQIGGDNETVIIVPADQYIKDNEKFTETIQDVISTVDQGSIVTFGVKPTKPETGFGYIKVADKKGNVHTVEKFTEKPDLKKAQQYIKDDCYYWNCGMFAGKVSVFFEEFEKYAPEIYKQLSKLNFKNSHRIMYHILEDMPNISIDYAVMEKSDKLKLIELKSDWRDLGSWESMYELKEKDSDGNVFEGNVITEDVKNSFIYGKSKKLVTAIGLEDIVIVETEDAILACKKDRSQEVKKIYEKLKNNNDDTHLVHKTVFRPWGWYTCLADGDGYLTKVIGVTPGQKLSIQSHNHRSEHWVVLEGKALVVLNGDNKYLSPGQSIDIPLGARHSLQNPFDEDLKIIEVQKGDYISEDDIVRYEDMYGRIPG